MMPNGDPRDGFLDPTLTFMLNSYVLTNSRYDCLIRLDIKLTQSRLMKLSIKLQKVKAGWSIVHTEGSQIMITKQKYCISLSVDRFVLQNYTYRDEMPHSAPFDLNLHCLPKYPKKPLAKISEFTVFTFTKGSCACLCESYLHKQSTRHDSQFASL